MSQTQPVLHTDSLEQDEYEHEVDSKKAAKSKRPANTAFRQQRLKAWQPILTPKTVLPLFFIVGIIFAPIGAVLLWASAQVEEIRIDYSNCLDSSVINISGLQDVIPANASIPSQYYDYSFKTDTPVGGRPTWAQYKTNVTYKNGLVVNDGTTGGTTIEVPVCALQFEIPNPIGAPVFFYYQLTNFYQNHRRYVSSYDTAQLSGTARGSGEINNSACNPLYGAIAPPGHPKAGTFLPYYPCGLIANSLFNDTFSSPIAITAQNAGNTGGREVYQMQNQGIAWSSDAALYGNTSYASLDVLPPPNWAARWAQGNDTQGKPAQGHGWYTPENGPPDLNTYEEFHVWMRTAGLPYFSKLALRNDADVMMPGTYRVDVQYNFPVLVYGGTKSIVISTRTVMGGKNPFLGIAYVVVGGLCVILGAMFTVAHLVKPRKLGDHTYLTWNNDQPSTGTSSGIQRPGDQNA